MNMRIKPLIALMTVILGGCSATSQFGKAETGGAVYTYKHTAATGEMCDISITSAREVINVDVEVTSDCKIKTTTNSPANAASVISVIGGLVERLPE